MSFPETQSYALITNVFLSFVLHKGAEGTSQFKYTHDPHPFSFCSELDTPGKLS